MYKLLPVYQNSIYIAEILQLLLKYEKLIFIGQKNPLKVFWDGLYNNLSRVVVAFDDDKFLGFVVLYDFHKLSENKFVCSMYGAANTNKSKTIEFLFEIILKKLKEQGCVALRCETKKYNMPMRMFARRKGFRKVGCYTYSAIEDSKYVGTELYEKIL